ncbi:MAG TPA: hypothetical protein VHN14_04485 [Kofleriaceae bacterium]|nr:hypothetical protein [Kofleriaceae bacterium]
MRPVRATIGGRRSSTAPISPAVVVWPRLKRTASRVSSGDRPRPGNTGDGWTEPEVQAGHPLVRERRARAVAAQAPEDVGP